MSLTLVHVPDSRYYLGQSGIMAGWNIQPGVADYVAGGYPITATQFELGRISGGWMMGMNSAGTAYLARFINTSTSLNGQLTMNLKVVLLSTGLEVAAGTDLSAVNWTAMILGW